MRIDEGNLRRYYRLLSDKALLAEWARGRDAFTQDGWNAVSAEVAARNLAAHEEMPQPAPVSHCEQAPPSTGAQADGRPASAPGSFLLLMTISLGLYLPVWTYRNARRIKAHADPSLNPVLETVLLFVPVICLFVLRAYFSLYRDLARGAGVRIEYSPWWCVLGYAALVALWRLPSPWCFFGLLSPLALVPVDRALRGYWAVSEAASACDDREKATPSAPAATAAA